MARKPDPRQLSLLDWNAPPQTTMQSILEQYHLSAVTGDGNLQHDAVGRFTRLYEDIYSTIPDSDGRSKSDVMRELFEQTAAPARCPVLFGQAFERIVNLGPCLALLQFGGFYTNGTSLYLRAVNVEPFVSPTGFRSCSSVSLAGYSDTSVHHLNGMDPVDWLTAAAKRTLDLDKSTGEPKVVPLTAAMERVS